MENMDGELSLHMTSLQIQSESFRELLAEFLGTFVLAGLGCSSNANLYLKNMPISSLMGPWVWGLALTSAIYVCGGVSGGHVNPSVTLGLASVGKLPWSKVPHYLLGQTIGAFAGSALTYTVYREAINEVVAANASISHNITRIFIPVPANEVSDLTRFIDQTVCVAFFLLIINAITDDRNMSCSKGLVPLVIGIADLTLVIFAFGYNAGAPINPALDISPRFLTWIIGWDSAVFSFEKMGHYWIPLVGCLVGGILGSWTYRLFIENHWPEDLFERPSTETKLSANMEYFFNNKTPNRVHPI